MAKKVDSFPISAKWVYIYSLSGVNLKATNGQIFSLPSGFFALSRDEIQKFFTNNYITVEYDDEDVGFTLFCYDFAVVGIQPASDITMAGLVQVSSDTNLQVKKIVGSNDEIKALVDSISGALSSLSGVVSDTDTKVDVIGGNTTAANALLSDLKDELIKVYTVCETIANADPDTVLVEMDENVGKIYDNTVAGNSLLTDLKTALGSLSSTVVVINSMLANIDSHASNIDVAIDAIGGNTTAANSLLQNIKDEITKAYTACESLIAGQGVENSSLSAIDGNLDTLNTSVSSINTFVDAIGGNTTAANSLLSDLKDELTKVYTVCQSILEKGVDSTVTDIDTKVDAIGASVVALNTTASGSKDELTKIYTACQTITTNQGSISSVLAGLDTKVDAIGASIVAMNTTVSNIHTELLNIGVTEDNILSGVNAISQKCDSILDSFVGSVSCASFLRVGSVYVPSGGSYDAFMFSSSPVLSAGDGFSIRAAVRGDEISDVGIVGSLSDDDYRLTYTFMPVFCNAFGVPLSVGVPSGFIASTPSKLNCGFLFYWFDNVEDTDGAPSMKYYGFDVSNVCSSVSVDILSSGAIRLRFYLNRVITEVNGYDLGSSVDLTHCHYFGTSSTSSLMWPKYLSNLYFQLDFVKSV